MGSECKLGIAQWAEHFRLGGPREFFGQMLVVGPIFFDPATCDVKVLSMFVNVLPIFSHELAIYKNQRRSIEFNGFTNIKVVDSTDVDVDVNDLASGGSMFMGMQWIGKRKKWVSTILNASLADGRQGLCALRPIGK